MFQHVKEYVASHTPVRQQPWILDGLPQSIYLAPAGGAPASSPTASPAPIAGGPSEAERAWEATKDTTSVAVLDEFVRRFADTFYAALAREKLEQLKAKSQVAVVPQPERPQASAPGGPAASVPVPTPSSAANLESRVALVIGNADYRDVVRLKNPVNDARLVSSVFRSLGFSVITRVNVGHAEFVRALQAFQDQAKRADVAAVYYSGHALSLSGTNYLIPVDAKLKTDFDLTVKLMTMDGVLAAIEGARQLRLLFFDACRDNPFTPVMTTPGSVARSVLLRAELTRGILAGVARIDPASNLSNTLIVYAAKDGQVALDGDGDNSPFATALAKHLVTPNLDIRLALGRVRDDVFRATRGLQEPFIYGSLGGEVFALSPSN